MKKKVSLSACALSIILSAPALANGLQEDRPWQFENSIAKQYHLNSELARIQLKNGGFKQIFNVSADGGSTVYVGNNTSIGSYQSNIANQSNVNVNGDGNSVGVGQENVGSNQGNNAGGGDGGDQGAIGLTPDVGIGNGNGLFVGSVLTPNP